jgi:hypothetical protein
MTNPIPNSTARNVDNSAGGSDLKGTIFTDESKIDHETDTPQKAEPKGRDENAGKESETKTEGEKKETIAGDGSKDDKSKEKPKKYAGKFDNDVELEKSYVEAQKLISKKAEEAEQYKKELEIYRKQQEEAQLKKEVEAKQSGFASAEERKLAEEVEAYEFNQLAQALSDGLAGDNYEQSLEALKAYQNTGDRRYLDVAKSFFSPKIIEEIAKNKFLLQNQRGEALRAKQAEAEYNAIKSKVADFCKEVGEWLNDPTRQEVVGEYLRNFGSAADLHKIKDNIEKIEANALKKEEARRQSEEEKRDRLNGMNAPAAGQQTQRTGDKPADWRNASDGNSILKALYKT